MALASVSASLSVLAWKLVSRSDQATGSPSILARSSPCARRVGPPRAFGGRRPGSQNQPTPIRAWSQALARRGRARMLARHDSIPFPCGRGQEQPVWARGRTRSSAVAAWMVLSCATGDLSTPTTTRGHLTPGATWSSELPVAVPGTSKPSQGALHTPPRPRGL
jgi:hypothetical protein